jgi:hypothetical protein
MAGVTIDHDIKYSSPLMFRRVLAPITLHDRMLHVSFGPTECRSQSVEGLLGEMV